MKKRILTMLLAVCLVLALGTVSALADGNDVAQIGDTGYVTIADALQAAGNAPTTINVIASTSESITIGEGQNITLNLNEGVTLTQSSGHTIHNKGTLTVTGSGVIQNTQSSSAALFNTAGATAYLNGSKFYGTTWYVIKNLGTMTIDGAEVEQDDAGSSNIDNGWVNASSSTGASDLGVAYAGQNAVLIIESGTFDGGMNIVKNDDASELTINGGTFTNTDGPAVLNWNIAEINGGSFTVNSSSSSVIANGYLAGGNDEGQLTIRGGTFTASNNGTGVLFGYGVGSANGGSVTIEAGEFNGLTSTNNNFPYTPVVTGGKFTDENVKEYFPDGSALTLDDEGNVIKDDENAIATVDGMPYSDLNAAIAAVPEGGTIEIIDDILDVDLNEGSGQNGVFNINSGMAFTINGNGHTIRVSTDHANADTNVHVFNVTNGEVTFTNLTVDGGGYARHGIQAHGAKAEVILNNVTSINNEGYGVIANAGGTVTANYLTTDDNGWGGVNVEANGQTSTFNMKDGNLKENASIVFEDEDGTGSANAKLDGGNFNTLEVKTANVSIDINGGSYDSIVVADDVTLASGVITVDGASFNEPVSGIAETEDYQVYYGGVYSYYDSFSKAWNAVGRGNANAAIAYVGEGSGAAAEVVTFKVGEKTVTCTVPYGFELSLPSPYNYSTKFLGWECSRDGDLYKVNAKYTVYRDVTFTATYEVTGYNIYIDRSIENGEVSTSPSGSAAAGETVYIYVDPDTGYVLDELTASWGYNYRYELSLRSVRDGVYRFTMPEGNVYITATFERSNLRMPFTDVNRGDWFYDAVYYVWANDMMEGVSDTSFNPNGSMTRAMFWAVLGRIDGETITGSDWVEEARDWAMSEGVSDGENPYALVTREQMVTMLWRYAGEPGRSANLNRYTDAGSISDWAEDAMEWAIARGVIDGMTSTTLQPQGTATRAHCATIFMRYDQL